LKYTAENELPFKYGDWGSKYFFNTENFSFGTACIKPGKKIEKHSHSEEIELFYFISGECEFIINEKIFRTKPGDAFMADVNEEHSLINDTGEPVRFVINKIRKPADEKTED